MGKDEAGALAQLCVSISDRAAKWAAEAASERQFVAAAGLLKLSKDAAREAFELMEGVEIKGEGE